MNKISIEALKQVTKSRNDKGKTRAECFWNRIKIKNPDDCWEWQGSKSAGYGTFYLNGKVNKSHRIAYMLTHGEIPENLFILHICDNPVCCNPNHLRAGTYSDNSRDMYAKGRHPCRYGEQHQNSKLNEKQVVEIKRKFAAGGITKAELAREYKISHSSVVYIVSGRNWRKLNIET